MKIGKGVFRSPAYVVDLAHSLGIHSELVRHLDVCVRQVVAPADVDPELHVGWNRVPVLGAAHRAAFCRSATRSSMTISSASAQDIRRMASSTVSGRGAGAPAPSASRRAATSNRHGTAS